MTASVTALAAGGVGLMSTHEFSMLLLALGVLLTAALVLGELARGLGQPAVVGEILAGILLGPTILGHFFPALNRQLFPLRGDTAVALKSLSNLSIVMFMLVAGMELDLSRIRRQGMVACKVAIPGILIPFGFGFLAAWLSPTLLGKEGNTDRLVFALFIATAFSVSALSVIARTLLDLRMYRSDLGMTVMAAAILNDLLSWMFFAVVLALMGTSAGRGADSASAITLMLAFTAFMLMMGRRLIHHLLTWVQAYLAWPAGVLGFIFILTLLSAAFTEWMGVRAIFGSFLVGVAIGDAPHLTDQTRTTLRQFIAFIFAPLFFASIGLHIDFIERFRLEVVLAVMAVAVLSKLLGCEIGARRAGLSRREAWAVAFGLNARGVMLILLADLALQYGVIRQRLFVALVILSLVTSMISGPVITRLLRGKPRDPAAAESEVHVG